MTRKSGQTKGQIGLRLDPTAATILTIGEPLTDSALVTAESYGDDLHS